MAMALIDRIDANFPESEAMSKPKGLWHRPKSPDRRPDLFTLGGACQVILGNHVCGARGWK
jgi:hypothetical protein